MGLYVDSKCSVFAHKYHPRVNVESIHIPTRLILHEEQEKIIALGDACVGSGARRNVLYNKLGKCISNAKVLWDVPTSPNEIVMVSSITSGEDVQ
eukprot:3869987-Ditylum_brightwellii.AAC.1